MCFVFRMRALRIFCHPLTWTHGEGKRTLHVHNHLCMSCFLITQATHTVRSLYVQYLENVLHNSSRNFLMVNYSLYSIYPSLNLSALLNKWPTKFHFFRTSSDSALHTSSIGPHHPTQNSQGRGENSNCWTIPYVHSCFRKHCMQRFTTFFTLSTDSSNLDENSSMFQVLFIF